eukprot:jgi/Chrzof1/901/Cz01g32360.t1
MFPCFVADTQAHLAFPCTVGWHLPCLTSYNHLRELHSRTMCMVHSRVWVVISRCCLPLLLALSTHTQPHFACPVPSVELPCLYIYNHLLTAVSPSS